MTKAAATVLTPVREEGGLLVSSSFLSFSCEVLEIEEFATSLFGFVFNILKHC